MNKKLSTVFKLFYIFMFFALIFFIIIPQFVNLIVSTPSPFNLGFIDETNKDTWINFFGSIIGGGATLLGVWWTIEDNGLKRKEELNNIDFPIPMFDLSYNKSEKQEITKLYTIDKISFGYSDDFVGNYIGLPMYIYNLYDANVFNVRLAKCEIDVYYDNETDNYNKYILNEFHENKVLTKIIPKNCKINTEFLIPIFNDEILKEIIKNGLKYNICLYFTYTNQYNTLHSQTVMLYFDHMQLDEQDHIYYTNKTHYVVSIEDLKQIN